MPRIGGAARCSARALHERYRRPWCHVASLRRLVAPSMLVLPSWPIGATLADVKNPGAHAMATRKRKTSKRSKKRAAVKDLAAKSASRVKGGEGVTGGEGKHIKIVLDN